MDCVTDVITVTEGDTSIPNVCHNVGTCLSTTPNSIEVNLVQSNKIFMSDKCCGTNTLPHLFLFKLHKATKCKKKC